MPAFWARIPTHVRDELALPFPTSNTRCRRFGTQPEVRPAPFHIAWSSLDCAHIPARNVLCYLQPTRRLWHHIPSLSKTANSYQKNKLHSPIPTLPSGSCP